MVNFAAAKSRGKCLTLDSQSAFFAGKSSFIFFILLNCTLERFIRSAYYAKRTNDTIRTSNRTTPSLEKNDVERTMRCIWRCQTVDNSTNEGIEHRDNKREADA